MLLPVALVALLCVAPPLVFSAAAYTALSPRRSLDQPGDRIVGGQAADIKSFPYQLSLREYFRHVCGASVISKNFAVSAAHCVYQRSTFCEKVVGGSSDLNDFFYATRYIVKKNNVHAKFDPTAIDYDVSVLRVWPDFRFGNRLSAVTLPLPDTPLPVNTSVVVSGWGLLAENGLDISRKLQSATVYIQDTKTCNVSYSGLITPRMICASAPGKDACQGDSGGPLVIKNSTGTFLVGIVSFGQGCAEGSFPGVYTKVPNPEIRSFISQIAGV